MRPPWRPAAGSALRAAALAIALLTGAVAANAATYAERPDVQAFIQAMVERHGFVEAELVRVFAKARRQEGVLRAIQPQAPDRSRSWQTYRSLFVNPRHIEAGVAFHARHREALQRASREYGVPEAIIVAIIGVETFYGRNAGRWRVADALTTLAFDYPPRAEFFRGELESYLLMVRDADLDVFSVRGSYAGAIGIPQFMPSSQRRYAVDFDGNGAIDLRGSATDAIGSVANFLISHGWRTGEAVFQPARFTGGTYRELTDRGLMPSIDAAELQRLGIEPGAPLTDTRVSVIELDNPDMPSEYRLGLANFYVLTRYNRSSFYASAVSDLAESLSRRISPQ